MTLEQVCERLEEIIERPGDEGRVHMLDALKLDIEFHLRREADNARGIVKEQKVA